MYMQYNYTLEFAICIKNVELLKLYSKENTNHFFFLIKLLFIRISCLFCLIQFIDSNEGVEKFFNKREHQKRMCKNKGWRHLCILSIEVSRKLYAKAVCFLIVLWLQKEF